MQQEKSFIGISENRLKHMLGVARKAYAIAKEEGYDNAFCRKMFMAGYIHDVGYEFCKHQSDHLEMSAILYAALSAEIDIPTFQAIREHGKYTEEETAEWRILTTADMLVSFDGKECTVSERLEDIKNRHGEHSDEYLTACDICYRVGLTAINFAQNTF